MPSVGRVRGLAAALGVGAAFLTGCGIAAAAPGSPDASSDGASSAHDSAAGHATTAGPTSGLSRRRPHLANCWADGRGNQAACRRDG